MAFPLGAILLALAPLAFLEAALALLGVADRRADDALVGFGSASPLFELEEDGATYCTARSRQLFFGRQQFAREKPERTFRIFGLGGSTVRGRPYETDSAFLKWLEIELDGRDAARQYETVNCGGLSYASYRLTAILDEVLGYDPDLVIVATGHNEFLEDRSYQTVKNRARWLNWAVERGSRLRTVVLARRIVRGEEGQGRADQSWLDSEVEARLDDADGYSSYHRDERWRRNVIDEYERSLRRMVNTCRQAGVPLILVNLGENLRDCPPFKSEHKAGLSAESLQAWQALFDQGRVLEDTNLDEALGAYRKAESIDDQYALLAYRMARVFDWLGRFDEARRYYCQARELDICPLRMIQPLHDKLKRVAEETATPLVDAESLAAQISPEGIPGNNCFMDHVHPNISSHQRIARLLAERMESLGMVCPSRSWNDGQRRAAYRRYFRRLGPAFLANGRRRLGWEENWARRERLESEAAPKDVRGHLHLGQKRLDWGEVDAAWEQFVFAMARDPHCADRVFAHALALVEAGRSDLAEEVLVRLDGEPAAALLRPAIRLAYVIAALDSGQPEKAAAVYGRSRADIDPLFGSLAGDSPCRAPLAPWLEILPDLRRRVESELGPSLAEAESSADPFERPAAVHKMQSPERSDQRAAVMDLLDKAINRNPASAPLYMSRARIHFGRQNYQQALADVSRAIEISPEDAEAYKFRSILHVILDNTAQALADLDQALAIEPGNPELLRLRAGVYRQLGDGKRADAERIEAARSSGR